MFRTTVLKYQQRQCGRVVGCACYLCQLNLRNILRRQVTPLQHLPVYSCFTELVVTLTSCSFYFLLAYINSDQFRIQSLLSALKQSSLMAKFNFLHSLTHHVLTMTSAALPSATNAQFSAQLGVPSAKKAQFYIYNIPIQ